jgi:DNA recombination protein RmuC
MIIAALLSISFALLYYFTHLKLIKVRAILEQKEIAFENERTLYKQTEEEMKVLFQSVSHEVMQKNSSAFLDLAKHSFEEAKAKKEQDLLHIVNPMKESLAKLDLHLHGIQKERKVEASMLSEQLKILLESEKSLRDETANLVQALRAPNVRGKWGEVQLRRIVEMAGMLSHCDFIEQQTLEKEESRQRPDMIVYLPSDRSIVIDAKAPFEAFLDSNKGLSEAEKDDKMKEHAKQLRSHISLLSKKSYFENFKHNLEFVVMFLPSESFFTAALSIDPSLIEFAAEKGVIIATPSTLIGLLKAVAFGWKQDQFSKNAELVSKLGHELYKRLSDMNKHLSQLGRSINSAAHSYNKAMGSFESRVLVSARKLKELGAAAHEIELDSPEFIDTIARDISLNTNELLADISNPQEP